MNIVSKTVADAWIKRYKKRNEQKRIHSVEKKILINKQ
jgi:hypothetical protein